MTSLAASSIVHADGGKEYYLGDKPGLLQYKKTKEELTSIPNINHKDSDCGYVQVPATPDLLNRFVPDTETGRKGDWELLVVFSSDLLPGEIWQKGALRNKKTGEIALMTCTNKKENITSRHKKPALKTKDGNWFVGQYRMAAPMIFWRAVAAALN
jgi:hypothetical protein